MATLSDRYNERPHRKPEMAGLRKRVLELEQQVEQLQEMMPINTALLARNGELERQLAEHHTRVQHPMEMGKWVQQEDWESLVKERNQLRDELANSVNADSANDIIHEQGVEIGELRRQLAAPQEVAGKMREALVASRPYVNVRVETMIDAALALDTSKVAGKLSKLEAVAEAVKPLEKEILRIERHPRYSEHYHEVEGYYWWPSSLAFEAEVLLPIAEALQALEEGEKKPMELRSASIPTETHTELLDKSIKLHSPIWKHLAEENAEVALQPNRTYKVKAKVKSVRKGEPVIIVDEGVSDADES